MSNFEENDYVPKRFGISMNPPQIVVEYNKPSKNKLYHHKIKIKNLSKETKIQEFRQQHKNLYIKQREEENQNYKKRIKNQKAFINPKAMDKDFQEEHTKTLMQLKKIGNNENVVLPTIKSTHDNPGLMESKKYYNTESGLRKETEINGNKMKSVDESESGRNSFYNSRKGSGAESIDK